MPTTARKKAGSRRRKPAALCPCGIAVDAEEREHLVEACAFFRADHFREADPEHLRTQDRKDAAARIDAVLARRKRLPQRAARPRRHAKGAGND
jgi:hypothetical protein